VQAPFCGGVWRTRALVVTDIDERRATVRAKSMQGKDSERKTSVGEEKLLWQWLRC
jgi:hypothetical protein